MQIAPVAGTMPAGVSELRAGDTAPRFDAGTPLGRVMNAHMYDYESLPGFVSFIWHPADPTWVQVNFRNETQRVAAARILEPTVLGAQIRTAMSTWAGGSDAPDTTPLAYQDSIALVDAMPGVWYHREQRSQPDQDGLAVFWAVTPERRRALDEIVRDTFDGATREDGTVKHYAVQWDVPTLPPH